MSKHSKTKKDAAKKKKNIGLKIFLIILIIIAVGGAFFAKRVYDLHGNLLAALMGQNKNTLQNLDRMTFLVLGESGGNTDTIMVWTYDPKTQSASVLSIPRDTFVGKNINTAKASDKINEAYKAGSDPMNAVNMVNKITGLDIKNYILIDTDGLKQLVDSIGGINFDVPIDMNYDDASQNLHIHLKAGYQHLNGAQVEGLTRFRHNNNGTTYPNDYVGNGGYGGEDFGRQKTQRDVIKTIAKQMISFKNITQIWSIINTLQSNVKTNINLSSAKDYLPYAMSLNLEDVKMEQLPATTKTVNEVSFVIYDKEATRALINEMFQLNQNIDSNTNTVNQQ
ncbi:MAG: LCP family protein [Firmicutes bacterium]|nr:LCP family protein [Bacillota bacterium]